MMAMAKQLLGPFAQMVTMDHLPDKGPLLDERLEIIHDGGVIIEGDRILDVLDEERFKQVKALAEMKGSPLGHTPIRRKMVLLPGLIDCHTHICYAGSRAKEYSKRISGESYLQISERGGGIMSTVRSTRQATEEELASTLAERAFEHLLRGVTTCEVKSGYGLDLETEIKMLRAIRRVDGSIDPMPRLVPTCLAAHVRPPEFKTDQHYLDFLVSKLLPLVKREGLANRVDIYIDRGAFAPELADGYLFQAKNMGFTPVVHADQFVVGGAAVAARVGAISADHLERSTEREFKWLREKGVVAVALPGSSLGLGDPFAPARHMLDAGLCVAIASDWNPGTAPMGGLLTQASLLSANQRLTAAETFAGLTIRAARALGLEDRGAIKTDHLADLIGFTCDSYEEILYRQGALSPSMIIKGGKRIMRAPGSTGG
jgi:imidazolonepropionase